MGPAEKAYSSTASLQKDTTAGRCRQPGPADRTGNRHPTSGTKASTVHSTWTTAQVNRNSTTVAIHASASITLSSTTSAMLKARRRIRHCVSHKPKSCEPITTSGSSIHLPSHTTRQQPRPIAASSCIHTSTSKPKACKAPWPTPTDSSAKTSTKRSTTCPNKP